MDEESSFHHFSITDQKNMALNKRKHQMETAGKLFWKATSSGYAQVSKPQSDLAMQLLNFKK